MRRHSRGNALILVLAVTFILIIIGVGAFFTIQLMGGGKQTISAADAGGLNVAKIALLAPSVLLDPTDKTNNTPNATITYGDVDTTLQSVCFNGNNYVNLLNFNKIVAYALQQAAYAQAGSSPAAIANAHQFWLRVEGDPKNSLGAKLSVALANKSDVGAATGSGAVTLKGNDSDVPAGAWPSAVFSQAAQANPTLLAATNNQISWQSFDVGYLGAGDSTNVLGSYFTNNPAWSPPNQSVNQIALTVNGTALAKALTADGFVPGYQPVQVAGDKDPYYFVTVYHDQTAGLRTNTEFSSSSKQPGADAVVIPPNTFYNHAQITMQQTGSNLAVGSPATVGTKAYPPIGPPPAYLILDNSPETNYKIEMPIGCHDVSCDQLGPGIFLAPTTHTAGTKTKGTGGLFSTNQADLQNLITYLNNGKTGTPPPMHGIYLEYYGANPNSMGILDVWTGSMGGTGGSGWQAHPLTAKELSQLQVDQIATPVLCNDQNSDVADANAEPNCQKSYQAFNDAYHKEGPQFGGFSEKGLTAAEIEKDIVCTAFCKWISWLRFVTAHLNQYPDTTINPSVNDIPYVFVPVTSGLGQYYTDANPITKKYAGSLKGIPWSDGKEFGQVDLGDKDYLANAAHQPAGKITKPFFSMDDIIKQTTTDHQAGSPYYMKTSNTKQLPKKNPETFDAKNDPGQGNEPLDVIKNYFYQRCGAMGANKDDIDNVWNNTQIAVGDVWYVYMDPSSSQLIASQTPPPNAKVPKGVLDGPVYDYYTDYSVLWSIVNAQYDFGIRDRLFEKDCAPGGGSIMAYDHVMLETESGSNFGCQGRIKFYEKTASSNPPQFCSPD